MHRIVDDDWDEEYDLGGGRKILIYRSKDLRVIERVAFEHICDRAHRNAGTLICAPELQLGNGHEIVTHNPLTIVRSILCSDCGTHGHVTDGVWVAA